MERQGAFVVSPSLSFGIQHSHRLCRRNISRHYCHQRQRQAVAMVSENSPHDRRMPIENLTIDGSTDFDMPELIVEVGEGDPDDESIVDILGDNFDVKTEKRKKTRKRTNDFVEEITLERDTLLTSDADGQPPIEHDETTKFVRTVVRAADERKGEDVLAIRISKLTYVASFVVIVTGNNTPQIRAIGNLVEEDLAKKHGVQARRRDGTANSGWLLLDYGDFMVNIFSPEQRANYDLESLWRHGEELDISDYITGPQIDADEDDVTSDSLDDWLS